MRGRPLAVAGSRYILPRMSTRGRLRLALAAALLCLAAAPAPPTAPTPSSSQAAPGGTPVLLRLASPSGPVLALGAADLEKLQRRTVQATSQMGGEKQPVQAEYSGWALHDVLHLLGVPEGEALRGEALRFYVVAEGADGYRVVFALAELDPSFHSDTILVADRRDGKPLSAREGPLRLVVPAEKRPARWVRQLVRLTVGQVN